MRRDEVGLRRVIREMLLTESVLPPNFANEASHSMGWISPLREYHFDPQRPDHGDWALQFAKSDPALAPQLETAIRPIIEPPGLSDKEKEQFEQLRQREDDARARKPGAVRLTWREMQGIAGLREKMAGKPGDPYKDVYKLSLIKFAAKDVLLNAGWGKVSNAYTLEIRGAGGLVIEKWMELAESAPGHNPEATHRIFGSDKKLAFEGSYWEINPRNIRT